MYYKQVTFDLHTGRHDIDIYRAKIPRQGRYEWPDYFGLGIKQVSYFLEATEEEFHMYWRTTFNIGDPIPCREISERVVAGIDNIDSVLRYKHIPNRHQRKHAAAWKLAAALNG